MDLKVANVLVAATGEGKTKKISAFEAAFEAMKDASLLGLAQGCPLPS